jgi:hypothetical protein
MYTYMWTVPREMIITFYREKKLIKISPLV